MILAVLAPVLALATAQPARYPFASSPCKVGSKSFVVKLDSFYQPNDPENDSEGAQFVTIGGKEAERRTGKYISDGAYTFVAPPDGSVCERTAAFAVGGKLVAVLYQEDNRPFQGLLHAAFFDPAAGKVVKVEKKLGPLMDVIATDDGFAFSNLVARSDADTMTRKSPWGTELSGTDKDLGAFRRVSLKEGKVSIVTDPDLSFEKSPWKQFYSKKEDYLADAGWDEAAHEFRNKVVYELSYFDRRKSPEEQKCIGMTAKRRGKIPEDRWHCLKLRH